MIKYLDKSNLKGKGGYFGLQFQRDTVYHGRKDVASGREGMEAGAGGWPTLHPHLGNREL